jgi:hypothetical protein
VLTLAQQAVLEVQHVGVASQHQVAVGHQRPEHRQHHRQHHTTATATATLATIPNRSRGIAAADSARRECCKHRTGVPLVDDARPRRRSWQGR